MSDSASPGQLESIAEAFCELFNLMEQYAPVWYAEEHRNKALAALHALEEVRQRAKSKSSAARSQKAG